MVEDHDLKMKVHHLGYAVKNIDEGIAKFRALGYECFSRVTEDSFRNVSICFLRQDGWIIELVAPRGNDSPVNKKLLGGVGGPYHICYEVDSLTSAIDNLSRDGFVVFEQPQVAPALEGRRVTFLFNQIVGIIELVESKGGSNDI